MIDPYNLIRVIEKKFESEDLYFLAKEIDDRIQFGSSRTEILMSVTHFLKHLKEKNAEAFIIAENEINKLIEYLSSIGLIME